MTKNSTSARTPSPNRDRGLGGLGRTTFAIVFGLLMILAPIDAATASHAQSSDDTSSEDCQEDGVNMECNEFGKIQMPTTKKMKGSPVNLAAQITLETSYEDRDARWIMFSIRNVTDDGDSPVTIDLESFNTSSGDVVTTRTIQDQPSELNLWVDVLDLPTGEQITLEVEIGVTERGAFAIETVVIPFDRGYEPIKDDQGDTVSLYSSTLLAVNGATTATTNREDGSILDGNKVPGAAAGLAVLLLGATAVMLNARRDR